MEGLGGEMERGFEGLRFEAKKRARRLVLWPGGGTGGGEKGEVGGGTKGGGGSGRHDCRSGIWWG